MHSPSRLVEELMMIRSSLLPGEHLTFLDSHSTFHNSFRDDNTLTTKPLAQTNNEEGEALRWERILSSDSIPDAPSTAAHVNIPPARFRVAVDGAKIWFEVNCQGYDGECRTVNECISINGDNLTRTAQEQWRKKIKESLVRFELEAAAEYPLYQLISTYLLPFAHETLQAGEQESPIDLTGGTTRTVEPHNPVRQPTQNIYHVLFTSHHLISPTKRRNLQSWSSDLRISGFAKVGYPGVIYAQGWKDDIEEFVGNIKAMQWLALKVRFLEPFESESTADLSGWKEFEKVGEVVEEMRRLGRGKYVVDIGIGSGARQ